MRAALAAVARRPRLLLAVVLALTMGLCAPALSNGFAYDGAWVVQVEGKGEDANPLIRQLHAPWVYWSHNFHHGIGAPHGLFRPATVYSFALTRAALGDLVGHARAQHLVNLLLHVLATALVWRLARRLRAGPVAAAGAAAVFGLHAIHSEVVGGVISRSELLACCCGLGGTLLALAGPRLCGPRRAAAAMLLFVAFSCKESATPFFGLVFVVALAAGVEPGKTAALRVALAGAVRATATTALPALVAYFALRIWVLSGVEAEPEPFWVMNPLLDADATTRVVSAMPVWARGLLLTLFPHRLVCDYSAPVLTVRSSLLDPAFLAATLLLLATLAATLWSATRRPILFVAGAAFFGFSLVTSNLLFALGAMFAERFYYTPSIGAALLAAWLLDRPRAARWIQVALVAWLTWNAVLLSQRIPVWRDSATLFAHDLEVQPRSARLHALNARIASERGDHRDAVVLLRRAVELEPRYASAWVDLGAILIHLGEEDAGVSALQRGIDAPWQQLRDRPGAYLNLARLERQRGRPVVAAGHLRAAVDALPEFMPAWIELRALADEAARAGRRADARGLVQGIDPAHAPQQVRIWLLSLQR